MFESLVSSHRVHRSRLGDHGDMPHPEDQTAAANRGCKSRITRNVLGSIFIYSLRAIEYKLKCNVSQNDSPH